MSRISGDNGAIVSKIDVIVPVFNERASVEHFYHRIRAIPLDINLIFVDNASTDGTLSILETFEDIVLIKHARNEGYGASLCDGIKNSSGDIIAIIDADCEYPPEALPRMVRELEHCDVVYASRFLDSDQPKLPFLKKFGNQFISALFNMLFRQNTTDLYTGCKVFRRSVVERFTLERKGFEHVLELGVKIALQGIDITDVHVRYSPRSKDKSKMRHLQETVKYLGLISYYYINRNKWKS